VEDPADAVARINAEADVIAFDGHSDYGRALVTFHDKFAKDLTKRSTVLILGDARNNYHQAHAEVLADLHYRARSVLLAQSRAVELLEQRGLDHEPVRALLQPSY